MAPSLTAKDTENAIQFDSILHFLWIQNESHKQTQSLLNDSSLAAIAFCDISAKVSLHYESSFSNRLILILSSCTGNDTQLYQDRSIVKEQGMSYIFFYSFPEIRMKWTFIVDNYYFCVTWPGSGLPACLPPLDIYRSVHISPTIYIRPRGELMGLVVHPEPMLRWVSAVDCVIIKNQATVLSQSDMNRF